MSTQSFRRRTLRLCAATTTLLVVALLGATASFAATAPLHGLQLHSLWGQTTPATTERELDMSRDLGANVVRLDVGWSSLETNGKGQMSGWYVRALDHFMDEADARGIKVIVMLWSTPCWASTAPDAVKQSCSGSWWERGVERYPPSNYGDYADISRWVTARYGAKLAALEVWNEPNPSQDFWKTPNPAADYVRLIKAAYPAAKSGDANVPVLAGSLSNADVPFLKELYANGMKGSYDGLAVHPYNEWRDPSDMWQAKFRMYTFLPGMRWVHETQVANGDSTPLWLTEFGWSSCTGGRPCVSRDQQASYTAKSTAIAAAEPYVRAYTLYALRDEGVSAARRNDNYGIVDRGYNKKPVYDALKAAWAGHPVAAPSVRLKVVRRERFYYVRGRAPRGTRVELTVVRCARRCRSVRAASRGRLRLVVTAGRSGRFARRLGRVSRMRHARVTARVLGHHRVRAAARLG